MLTQLIFLEVIRECWIIFQSHTELSYSQKLVAEHQKYQDLQQKHQRMQEDYEKRLKSAEESKTQALDELTLLYETRLQEKTQTLAQVSHDDRRREGSLMVIHEIQ